MTRHIVRGVAVLTLLASAALAQIDTGSIVGTVRDASGAAVPKATVTATNPATNITLTTTTNSVGEYQFNALHTGDYNVKAVASGFSAQVFPNVHIDVQSRPSVDFTLQVGNVNQTIEVQSTAPLLDTQTATLGGVVSSRQIEDLPLNGRRYADLALLEPGIQKNLTNPNNTAPDRFSSNGNLETQNYFSLDGVDNNSGSTNLQEGSVQTVQPPPDALQEFRVQTRTYSAEFGTSAGAVINASIKSGSNAFHGDLWEFLRNNDLDANSFFNNLRRSSARPFQPEPVWRNVRRPDYQRQDLLFRRCAGIPQPQGHDHAVHGSDAADENRQLHGAEEHAAQLFGTGAGGLHFGKRDCAILSRSYGAEAAEPVSRSEHSVRRWRRKESPGSWTRRAELPVRVFGAERYVLL